MLKGLAGKTVLVTGAAGGIGSAACSRLADEGANVVATDISDQALRVVAEALGDQGVGVAADITTSAGVAAGIDAAAAFGGIDLAFLNAGVECFAAPVAEFSEAEYERVFNVNVRGAFLAAQAVVNHLTAAGRSGNILFTASIAGLRAALPRRSTTRRSTPSSVCRSASRSRSASSASASTCSARAWSTRA